MPGIRRLAPLLVQPFLTINLMKGPVLLPTIPVLAFPPIRAVWALAPLPPPGLLIPNLEKHWSLTGQQTGSASRTFHTKMNKKPTIFIDEAGTLPDTKDKFIVL